MSLVQFPRQSVGDVNGNPLVGANAYFYQTGSSALIAVWADPDYSIALTNPVSSDSDGRFPTIHVDPAAYTSYKLVILDSDGATVYSEDRLSTTDSTIYPLTGAESIGGMIPVSHSIPSHEIVGYINPLRYMTAAQVADVTLNVATQDVTSILNSCFAFGASAAIPVCIPVGTCKFTSGLLIPRCAGFTLFGWGQNSILKASGVFSKAITIGDTAQQSIRGLYRDFVIDVRSATVQYGMYGARVEEHRFTHVFCWGASVSGFSIGYGYVNDYLHCEACYGADGFATNTDYLGGANNTINYVGCMALSNTGLGWKITNGYGVRLIGCISEQNKKSGALFNVMKSIAIHGCYFEGNGETGYAFDTPAVTVKADIIIVGSGTDNTMSNAFPCDGITIDACNTVPRSTSNAFVFNAGGQNGVIQNCYTSNSAYVPALVEMYDNQYKGASWKVVGCSSFSTLVSELSPASNVNNVAAASITIDCPTLVVESRNYADKHFAGWGNLASGSTTTYRKSATSGRTKFRGTDVYEIASGASGTSDTKGYQITATDYPELAGKLMWYGIWIYSADAACFAVPYCDEQSFNANPIALNTWSFAAVSFVWPASGTVDIGVFKTGANTGSVWFAAPMLCEVGFPHSAAIGLCPTIYTSPLQGSATYDPPSLGDGAGATTTVTVAGAALGDLASASFSLDTQGITITAWVSSTNTVSVRLQNESGGTLDIASGTLTARVLKTA